MCGVWGTTIDLEVTIIKGLTTSNGRIKDIQKQGLVVDIFYVKYISE